MFGLVRLINAMDLAMAFSKSFAIVIESLVAAVTALWLITADPHEVLEVLLL